MNGFMHTQNMYLSHTISRLIFIQTKIDHKDGNTILHNTTAFLKLKFETSG